MSDRQSDHQSDRQESSPPTLEQRARRRVALKKGWLIHALVFVLVNAGLLLMAWASSTGLGDGWGRHHGGFRAFPLWGWGLGLAIHGALVLLKLNSEGMTERMVAREIEALKQREGRG